MSIKTTLEGNIIIIEAEDKRLDMQSVPAFKDSVIGQLAPGKSIVLDLRAVDFIDSTGLGALLAILRRVKETDGTMVLVEVSEQTLAMFRLVKMTRIFDIYATREEALNLMNR